MKMFLPLELNRQGIGAWRDSWRATGTAPLAVIARTWGNRQGEKCYVHFWNDMRIRCFNGRVLRKNNQSRELLWVTSSNRCKICALSFRAINASWQRTAKWPYCQYYLLLMLEIKESFGVKPTLLGFLMSTAGYKHRVWQTLTDDAAFKLCVFKPGIPAG